MNINEFVMSEDAVSEVLDFVILLGIIIISLSVIALAGYPILKKTQDHSHIEYTRQNFIKMAENFNKVPLGQAPSQIAEFYLYEGSFAVTGKSSINITATNSTGQRIILADTEMRSIEGTIGETAISYEGTGVWVKYPEGATLNVYRPLISSVGNSLVIPVVNLNGDSFIAGSGISSITVKGTPEVVHYNNISGINIKINSRYEDGWKNYFRDILSWNECDTDECTVKLDVSGMDVYILFTQMDTVIK